MENCNVEYKYFLKKMWERTWPGTGSRGGFSVINRPWGGQKLKPSLDCTKSPSPPHAPTEGHTASSRAALKSAGKLNSWNCWEKALSSPLREHLLSSYRKCVPSSKQHCGINPSIGKPFPIFIQPTKFQLLLGKNAQIFLTAGTTLLLDWVNKNVYLSNI